MLGQYHKQSMLTTSKVGIKSIRSGNSRGTLLLPPFSWRRVHWQCSGGSHLDEEHLEISRVKLQNSTPDITISQGPNIKQLSQYASL